MQIFNKTLSLSPDSFHALDTFCHAEKENICFFDIETTGLSPKVSSLYLIGALWYNEEEKQFQTRQWFADDYISEKNLIEAFGEFLSGFSVLVHYNGTGFDLPYIEKKCKEYALSSPFTNIRSLDIFKEIRRKKALFDVPDLKLLTAEKLTGFLRRDCLSGKDCIETYSQYMQKKYFKDKQMELERDKLLLHNQDDLAGTYHCARLLAFRCGGHVLSVEENDTTLCVTFSSPARFPFPLKQEITSHETGSQPDASPVYTISYEADNIRLEIFLLKGELCHFFSNYKDYYYLPDEDTAIHKSVGTYVEKEFRQQAKASNCYTKKDGIFLPVPNGLSGNDHLLFRTDYKSKQHYLLWDSKIKQDSFLFEEILSILTSV